MNEITIVKEEEMQLGLQTTLSQRDLLRAEFKEVSQLELSAENEPIFRELRLKWAKNRTKGVNDWHKKGKAVSLAVGKWYDAKKNELNQEGEEIETILLNSENHIANVELERLKSLNAERIELVRPYLDDVEGLLLSGMPQDVFEAYLSTKKSNREALIETERLFNEAQAQLIEAEKVEKARVQKENDKLVADIAKERKDRELKEAEFKAASDKAEKILKEREAKEKKDREAKEALIKAESDKVLQEEKDARKKLEDELNDKLAAERNEAIQKEALAELELSKGDADKVKDLISDLNSIKGKYSFKSESNKKMYSDTEKLIDKIVNHIKQ
jgi:hypothetical protein